MKKLRLMFKKIMFMLNEKNGGTVGVIVLIIVVFIQPKL
jgi:hypothetical protein